jgi:hypothetical protein
MGQLGSGCPDFQFAALEGNRFAQGWRGINPVGRREQDQPVGKGCQGNHCKIQNRNCQDDAPSEQRFLFLGFHVSLESFFVKWRQ